jgi:hypothetical protein
MKNHYSGVSLLLLLSLGAKVAQAQADYRPGYIVRPAGDTVRGQVDYRGALRGAQECLFRTASGQEITAFSPTQLQAYGLVSGEHYVSRLTPPITLALPASTLPSPSVPDTTGQKLPAQPVFLEVLAEGEALLLARPDEKGQLHFYVQKATAARPTELVRRTQVVLDGNIKREQQIPVYRGTLTEQFADCPAVLLSLSRTEFTLNSLVAAVERYNSCRQPNRAVLHRTRRTEVGFEALLGGQLSQTVYSDHGTNSTIPGGLAPEVGLALHAGPKVGKQKLTVRFELHYVQQVAQGSYQQDEYLPGPNHNVITTHDLRLATAYLRLPVLLRYTLPGNKIRPFLEAGGSFSYATKLDLQAQETSSFIGSSGWHPLFSNDPLLIEPFRHNEYGYLAGLGVGFATLAGHSVSVVGRVERSDGFMTYRSYATTVMRANVLLSIELSRLK